MYGAMFAHNTVEGTGSAISITTGWTPGVVFLWNVDGDCQMVWEKNMGAGYGQKTVDSGSGATDVSTITTGGITSAANGFSIGTDSDVNVNAQTLMWMAFRDCETP